MSKKIQKIVSVTTSVATIVWMSGIGMLAPMAVHAVTIVEGDTVKTADNPDVYIAKYVGTKKFKRLILNPDVFNSYGHLSWSAIKTVSQAELDAFTNSDLVRADGDYKVYKLIPNGDVGTKQWVNMTAEQFTAAAYDWDSIYTINNVDRDNYTTGTDITTVAVGALTVALASDTPAAGIAPESASRVGFTKVSFTNTSASSVTIDSLTVERTGLASDSAISSVMLIDNSDNSQVDLNQTLNALHKVTFTEDITVPANSTKSITIAANMPASLDSYAGQLGTLALTAVSTTATVSGTLPITGNAMTINATLAIGSATINRGSLDPGTDATKEVGTTDYKFTGLKITAGSVEDMSVESIRFNQSGSAASSDLTNVKVTVDSTDYATTVSTDGKYYKVIFSGGITIGKGLNKELTVKGDIAGGSNRTASFDIYRDTDIVIKGKTYAYYRTVDGTSEQTTPTDGQFGTGTPFYEAYDVTVGTGSLRVDKNSTAAPAVNITEGGTGQILGAFDFVVQGEEVKVASIILGLDHTGTGSTSDITNITLTKSDGTVLAGPVDGTDETTAHATTLNGTRDGYATFSGTVNFPVGTTQVLVKGNLNTDFAADDTFAVGFETPATRVSSITGSITGNSITATPASDVWGNTMTVKAGSLTIRVSGTPVTQSVVRGITGFIFANYEFDASASGEDVRVTSIALQQIVDAAGNADNVSAIQIWDSATALNTGSNVVNPADTTATTRSHTFTLNNALIITKGTQKTIALKGNISGSATSAGTQQWGIASGASVTATGVSTANDITETVTAANGQTMTIVTSGQYSVALDASTPTGKLVTANTTGNIMTVLRFKATSEQINVSKVKLFLTNASSTGKDLANVYIYDGTTLLASGTFPNYSGGASGASNTASTTFTLSPTLQIPADGEKVVTVKADIAEIKAIGSTVATAGDVIVINYYGATDTAENVGTGASSGASIANYSASTAQSDGVIYRSVPTVAQVALPSTTLANGTMAIGQFKVTADAKGDIDLYKFTIKVATSDGTSGHVALTNLSIIDVTESAQVTLYASTTNYYQDAWTDAGAGYALAEFVLLASPGTPGTSATTTRTVAAGTSKTFELRATISGVQIGASVTTQVEGDSAVVDLAPRTQGVRAYKIDGLNIGGGTTALTGATHDDFIWSDWSDADHSTSALGASTTDFYNGYLVPGLPSSNLPSQTVSK